MASPSSAGVYVRERDLSQRIQAASTSIGAIVGRFSKGPVMDTTLVTEPKEMLEIFCKSRKPSPVFGYASYSALEFLKESTQLQVVRVVTLDTLTAGCYWTTDDELAARPVHRLTNFDDGSNQPLGIYDPYETLGFDPQTAGIEKILGFFCAANPGTWNNQLTIMIKPNVRKGVVDPDDPSTFYVEVYENYVSPRQRPVESWLVSRDHRVDGFNYQMNIEEVINKRSKYIRYRANPYAVVSLPVYSDASVFLDGGTDGSEVTDGLLVQGWKLMADPEQLDINILINGGYSRVAVQLAMDELARDRMDCIAVLDVPPLEQEVSDAVNYARNTLNMDTSYAALYSPDLYYYDEFNDRKMYVPPSGFAAAAMARTDHDNEVWFAPAGMRRGNVNVLGVRHVYNQGKRDALDKAHVNSIRAFKGKGYKIWGADTLKFIPSALSNVNVRRLLNYVEKSISLSILDAVFDPNDTILWARLRERCERFLAPIKAGRGLYQFLVVCDETNNRPETIANGDCMLDVYLDPVIPAKRIHMNAIITATGAVYKEVAASTK